MRLVILIVLIFNFAICKASFVAFDMDETLVQSDKLLNKDIERARELGFDVRTTNQGWVYIIRPGAIELLDYAESLGLELIMMSHNIKPYLETILSDSEMERYFKKVISQEDVSQKINMDFDRFPNHRNRVYPQPDLFESYLNHFYEAFIVRSFQRLLGNKNIHPYLPSTNNAKYPPMFGARVLIDDTFRHTDSPIDFVGIPVVKFFASTDSELSSEWIEPIKLDLKMLSEQGWIELYKIKYGIDPIIEDVEVLENLSKNFINDTVISFFSERAGSNYLNLCVS
jgi:hypothetical protein